MLYVVDSAPFRRRHPPSLPTARGALGVPAVQVGVDQFGHSGTIAQLYELHDLTGGSDVNAALAAIALS